MLLEQNSLSIIPDSLIVSRVTKYSARYLLFCDDILQLRVCLAVQASTHIYIRWACWIYHGVICRINFTLALQNFCCNEFSICCSRLIKYSRKYWIQESKKSVFKKHCEIPENVKWKCFQEKGILLNIFLNFTWFVTIFIIIRKH